MSCTGTSFVQRHFCFRVTTSLLTALPQLAHLALLQACIRTGFFTCMNPTAPQDPDQTSQGTFHAERKLLLLLRFSTCLTTLLLLFPLLPSSIQSSVDVIPQDFSGLFSLPEEELVQSSLNPFFAVTSQCLGQSMQEESTCGDKGQHVWLYCNT